MPDPTGRWLAFTTKGGVRPGLLDRATGALELGAWLDPSAEQRIVWLPGTNRVATSGRDGVTLTSLGTRAEPRRIATEQTIDVALANDHRLVYADEGTTAVHVLDLATGEEQVRSVPWGPYALEYVSARDALFVSSWLGSPKVARLGMSDGSYREAWNGWGSTDICAFPERGEIVVSRPAYGDLAVLDDESLARRQLIAVDPLVREIECDAADGMIFTASYLDGRVQAVRTVDGEVQDSVQVGSFVRALRYEPSTRTLFVGSSAGVFELPIHRKPSGDVRFGRRA